MLNIVLNKISNQKLSLKNLKVILKRFLIIGLFLIGSVSIHGQTNIKTMFYNLLNYSTSTISQNKTIHLKTILDDVQPDLFMVCELVNSTASDYLFTNAVAASNPDFEKATFQVSQSPATGLQQMVYYNKKKLILENSSIVTTGTRDINHYTFKINTVNIATNPIRLEVYVTHLKASSGSTNRQKRLNSVTDFVNDLANLDANSFVVFSGDFNLYTSNEEAYIKLLDTNNAIIMVDPIDRPTPTFPNDGTDYFDPNNYNSTYFWNNTTFKDIHTQSTRTYTSENNVQDQSGATGGMDDRFDFIMMSKNFTTSSNLFYVNNSYKSVGNNGNCYNSYVANSNCTGSWSQNTRNALHEFSDHLPVIMEIETPENTLSLPNYYQPITVIGNTIVHEKLRVKFNNLKEKTLVIYNQLGQEVKRIFKNINTQNSVIDVQNFSTGIYYIKTQQQTVPLKFVKK